MYRQIGLIGRDQFLKKEIYPRAQGKKAPFLLVGPAGIGKTAVLNWAYDHGQEPKALVSASYPVGTALKNIAEGWGLTITDGNKTIPIKRAKNAELEAAIFSQTTGTIYIDDIEKAAPTFLRLLKPLRERFKVFCAGTPPFRKEDLKLILWGLKELEIKPVEKKHRLRIATKLCQLYGSNKSPVEIAGHSRGFPKRILAMANGTTEVMAEKIKGEEIDLSPVLLFLSGGIIALRYIGRGMDDTALYLIGGLGIAVVFAVRFILYKGMK